MATLVAFADVADSRIWSSSATYLTARSGSSLVAGGAGVIQVGQDRPASINNCYEGFVSFDTSALVRDSPVSAASLAIFVDGVASASFTVEARVFDWGGTVTTADWVPGASLSGMTLLATAASAAMSAGSYATFVDVALPANVVAGGITSMVLASDNLRTATPPSVGVAEFVNLTEADAVGTTVDPKVTVTYTEARRVMISGDRVKETTTTTGTGDITLGGAATGYIAFSAVPNVLSGDVVGYAIVGTTEWEVGIGAYHTGPTLSRDRVLANHLGTQAAVNFSAGTKDVFNTFAAQFGVMPAVSRTVTKDALVPRSSSASFVRSLEVPAGITLELGVDAILEIT